MPQSGDALRGGEKMTRVLDDIGAKLGDAPELRVGFLADAKYPDGTPIAYIAAINEFGGSWSMPPREITVYRKISARTGDFLRGGKFVKKKASNFATAHQAAGYTHTQPARPFFRRMIAAHKGEWGGQIAALMKQCRYDARLALNRMGFEIEGQLQDSIKKLVDPPLAQSTIRKKKFDKPLIGGKSDSGGGGLMWQSTGHEVTDKT